MKIDRKNNVNVGIPEFYTPQEVAESLKVSLRALYLWQKEGKLTFVKFGDRTRISREELERFIAAGTAPKEPETEKQTPAHAADQIEASARKSPKDNCRTTPEERAQIAARNARFRSAPPTPPEYFAKKDTEETRSRRVQLLIKPSIYKEIREIAYRKRQSVNNLIEEIFSGFLENYESKKKIGFKVAWEGEHAD